MTTARRLAAAVTGFVGAEIAGALAFMVGISVVVIPHTIAAVMGMILAPAFAAAGGIAGFDIGRAWAFAGEDEARGVSRARVALHLAGMAAGLFVVLACFLLFAALPTWLTGLAAASAFLCLPALSAAGRRFAGRFVVSRKLLISGVAVAVTAVGLFVAVTLILAQVVGDD